MKNGDPKPTRALSNRVLLVHSKYFNLREKLSSEAFRTMGPGENCATRYLFLATSINHNVAFREELYFFFVGYRRVGEESYRNPLKISNQRKMMRLIKTCVGHRVTLIVLYRTESDAKGQTKNSWYSKGVEEN